MGTLSSDDKTNLKTNGHINVTSYVLCARKDMMARVLLKFIYLLAI